MKIQTCEFVTVSDVFRGLPLAREAFIESNHHSCSWGDNNRSLITPDVIIDALEQANDGTNAKESKQIKAACKRLEKLGQTYVDLEN